MKRKFNQQELFEQGLHGCNICFEIKTTSEFIKDKRKATGLNSRCKSCHNNNAIKYRGSNKEKIKASNRNWAKNNPERVKEKNRKNHITNVVYLADNYIKELIRDQYNIPFNEIIQLDISEKREQIQYKREIKLLTKKLKENEKVNCKY